ncbi:MAG: hypothetical protein ACOH2E_03955 [Candidatus Paracaedibacter sp.]
MKKQFIIVVSSLVLASGIGASQKTIEDHCFRPAFQKKLIRVHSVRNGSYRAFSSRKKLNQKEVFIHWQKLYWGKLEDLIFCKEETYADDVQEVSDTKKEENTAFLYNEDPQDFAKELRQELKSFAKQYGFKIVWLKKTPDIEDVTAPFLEYWDRGYSQNKKHEVIPFTSLSRLCPQLKNPSVRNLKSNIRKTGIRDGALHVHFSKPLLKTGE